MSQQPEQSIFDEEDGATGALRRRIAQGISKTRNTLYLIAGMLFLTDFIALTFRLASADFIALSVIAVIDVVNVGTLVWLGFWAKLRPFSAQLLALVLFVLLECTTFILHLRLLQHSLFIDLLIGGLLFSGLRRARVVQRAIDFQKGQL